MKQLFSIGDVIHIRNRNRNKDVSTLKTVTIPEDAEVTVLKHLRMDNSVGGHGYQVSYNDMIMACEIAQGQFYTNEEWQKYSLMKNKLIEAGLA